MHLFDPNGQAAGSSVSLLNTDEKIRINNPAAGYWKIKVDLANVSGSINYSIASNFPAAQQMFFLADAVAGTVYYRVNISSPAEFSLDSGGLKMQAFNNTGNLEKNSVNEGSRERLDLEPGTWILKIENNGNASVNYSITSSAPLGEKLGDKLSFLPPTPNNEIITTTNSIIINLTTVEIFDSATLEWNGTNESMTVSGNA